MSVRIINADVLDGLSQLADESVHCVVTSPPYWGLRDYGAEGQIGLEPTLQDHIAKLVEVFREVRRVLRPDGTLWLNYGDGYNAGTSAKRGAGKGDVGGWVGSETDGGARINAVGLKPKDLLMMPERLAIALQEDGWWVRSRIIWAKPNPMPESVTDRPTKSHEHIWLMSKSPRYWYDAEAIAETSCQTDERPQGRRARELAEKGGLTQQHLDAIRAVGVTDSGKAQVTQSGFGKNAAEVMKLAAEAKTVLGGYYREFLIGGSRNARDVWTIATAPFSEAHFATFPPELAERCIKAGTSERGCCAKCGAPWVRDIEHPDFSTQPKRRSAKDARTDRTSAGQAWQEWRNANPSKTVGWSRGCLCAAIEGEFKAVPCTVLDPFGGSGTTGLVADRLQRNAVLIELNPAYAEMARRRLSHDGGMFASVALEPADAAG